MKTVKAFDWWRETEGNGASVRKAWDAAQANMPETVCEWEWSNTESKWLTGCFYDIPAFWSNMGKYCPDCGGRVTIKQAAEQKLEAMTKECDRWMENDRLSSIRAETAEGHLDELVALLVSEDYDWCDADRYIRKNGLDK